MLSETLQHKRQLIYERMLEHLPKTHQQPELQDFYNHLNDYPQRQGKMLRGLFVLLSYESHSGNVEQDSTGWQHALTVAAALELFQNWVLIHDDIEDDSDERRGKPALHRKIAMPLALNVGDALHVYMWSLLHQLEHPQKSAILQEFATMIHRTAEGQHLDLCWVADGRFSINEEDYLMMVRHKTAYYTAIAPLRLGALCAGIKLAQESYVEAGSALGCAFQIRDDVLNLDAQIDYGKEFAGDLYEAKRTLILTHTFAHASAEEAEQLRARLGKARADKTPQDIDVILDIIDKYDSLAYAQGIAENYAETGMAQLCRELEHHTHLANSSVNAELLGLLDTVARRCN